MDIVSLKDLHKSYGKVSAVDGVSLRIARGETFALLGANGAGKTTLLDLLLGLRRPDSGSARLFQSDPAQTLTRRRVGVTPQQSGMPPTLRVREIVQFVAQHYHSPVPIAEILPPFGLGALAARQAGGLSGGELRRLGLALAFVGNPELVVLDEPTTGLDIEARRGVWDYIRAYAHRGGTVVLTTHYMEEADALASRIAVMNAGHIVADGSPAQIRARAKARRIVYNGPLFDPIPVGVTVQQDGSRIIFTTTDTDALVRAIVQSGVPFRDLAISETSLEDAVLSLTGDPQ